MAMDDIPMAWSPPYAALLFVMWWVMMLAMMVPSAAPKKVERRAWALIAGSQVQAVPSWIGHCSRDNRRCGKQPPSSR
jgi:predicted metal-binding membrane protein